VAIALMRPLWSVAHLRNSLIPSDSEVQKCCFIHFLNGSCVNILHKTPGLSLELLMNMLPSDFYSEILAGSFRDTQRFFAPYSVQIHCFASPEVSCAASTSQGCPDFWPLKLGG